MLTGKALGQGLWHVTGVSEKTFSLAQKCIERLGEAWSRVDDLVLANQAKVLDGFIREKISLAHMWPSTGYGYQDAGRDGLEKLYARIFGGEASLVRLHWASGTHVLKTVLFSVLRPGDELLSVTGTPYETLWPIIGMRERSANTDRDSQGAPSSPGSLLNFGIYYRETPCLLEFEENKIDAAELERSLAQHISRQTKAIFIQRSRGYSRRKSISTGTLRKFMEIMDRRYPDILTIVDNCYCEFTDTVEPPALGISMTAGSLIKNPGGGLAPAGGYVVGKEDCVRRVAEALYAPGLSGEVGSNPYGYRDLYQGLFLAPKVVGEALKGASFAALFFHELGFDVSPGPFDQRSDIVQSITLGSGERLKGFVRGIQTASPVDSYVTPEPWDMPGYEHEVIMAAGTFVQGSSIELSCDAPFVPPYTAYLQGGLTKEHVIIACMRAKEALENGGLLS